MREEVVKVLIDSKGSLEPISPMEERPPKREGEKGQRKKGQQRRKPPSYDPPAEGERHKVDIVI